MFRNYLSLIPLLLFASCISSLHQLVTYDKVITDNRVTGRWEQNDGTIFTIEELLKSDFYKEMNREIVNKQEKSTVFDSLEDSLLYSKSYIASFTKSGNHYTMILSLMRLGNDYYGDILPFEAATVKAAPSGKKDNLFDGRDYIPSHSLARLVFREAGMDIKFLDDSFIKKQLAEGRMAVSFEDDTLFNKMLITASSAGLQQFLAKYGNDERLYNSVNTVTLKKL